MTLLSSLHLAAAEYDYAIVEAIYRADLNRQILEFIHEKIEPEDVSQGPEGTGKEAKPHITILYGIKEHTPDTQKIQQVIQNHPAMNSVRWVGLDKFESSAYDVLIIKIDSPAGQELFKDFNNIYPDSMNSYPEYIPHTTLAYLKKGTADKYIEEFSQAFVDGSVPIQWIRFSFNDDNTDFHPASGEPRA